MIGLASVLVQTAAILRPLDRLRRDVAQRWEGDEVLVEAEYPEEVAPLVGDINTLLARNREIVARSRRQGATAETSPRRLRAGDLGVVHLALRSGPRPIAMQGVRSGSRPRGRRVASRSRVVGTSG